MDKSFILLYRAIKSHWIWQDPMKFRCWCDILLSVNFKDARVNLGMQVYDCKRGQSLKSLQTWATEWGVGKDWVRNFFVLLAKDGMILHESVGKSTRITVCNYDSYQAVLHDGQTQDKRKTNARQTDRRTREKEEEELQGKQEEDNTPSTAKVDVYPFEDFWNDYGKKRDTMKCRSKWAKISNKDKILIKDYLPKYVNATPDVQYRKNPLTFLNGETWNDEPPKPITKQQPYKHPFTEQVNNKHHENF